MQNDERHRDPVLYRVVGKLRKTRASARVRKGVASVSPGPYPVALKRNSDALDSVPLR
ncbi:hypothetical protein RSSM_05394 [Rhodopirellula sallentina SM41]|uniref:Uncharacterized protein n=1 Tax=Rhodopirellula sallentina SM41 TaxID=1263870 RepID=M5TVH6_9BACT|nr:hypothetical protein RSSM_05394 [Rhodopirellula sallentina SM41]